MRYSLNKLAISACLLATVATGSTAGAAMVARGQGAGRDATVAFSTVGDRLHITLTNSSTGDVLVPSDVLTGVFFDISGPALALSRESAVLGEGSQVHWGSAEMGGGVGGEWAYRAVLEGAPAGADYGISAAGLGLFGPHDSFPGANLDGQNGPQGLNFGLLSAGDNTLTGNSPVTGGTPLVQSSVVFTLSGLPAGFDLGSIGNVTFQYGTSLGEPSLPALIISVPAPGPAGVLAGGLLVLGRRRRGAARAV